MKNLFVKKKEKIIVEMQQGTNAIPLQFKLMDFDVPDTSSVTIYVQKPSGKLVFTSGSVSGNIITIPLTTQMTAEPGVSECQIRIVNGNDVLLSFVFQMSIEKSIINDYAIQSTNEFTALLQALATVADAVTHADLASKGSSSRPVYTNASGNLQPITKLGISYGGTNATTAAAALSNLGGAALNNLKSKGSSDVPVYGDANGVLQPCETLSVGAFGCATIADLIAAIGMVDNTKIFMQRDVDFTDVFTITKPGIYYINSTQATSLSNMPVQQPGTLEYHRGGSASFGYLLFHNNSQTNPNFYLSVKNTTFGAWMTI